MDITDEQAHAAFNFIHENADKAARAKAAYNYLKEYRKTVKALAMKRSQAKSATLAEVDAYADPEYVAHLKALGAAEENWEKYAWHMEASKITLEVWRTTQANNRGKDNAR